MKNALLVLMVIVVYLLHQDFWNWKKAGLVLGFLPVGLAYHAAYAIVAACLMGGLVKFAWPAELDRFESELEDEDKSPKS